MCFKFYVSRAGFQPATPILEESCSNAAELPGHLFCICSPGGTWTHNPNIMSVVLLTNWATGLENNQHL